MGFLGILEICESGNLANCQSRPVYYYMASKGGGRNEHPRTPGFYKLETLAQWWRPFFGRILWEDIAPFLTPTFDKLKKLAQKVGPPFGEGIFGGDISRHSR